MLNKKSIAAALMALFVSVPALAATEGVDYKLAEVEVAPLQKDKIEVTEFFAYWCPHCYDLEPVIARHIKTFASDTVFRAEHIVWDKQRDFGFARLAAAVKQSGTKIQANPFIFEAVIKQKVNLGNSAVLSQWLKAQTAFDGSKVQAAFDSFSNATQATQMESWTDQYAISGTPTVIVGGKYQVIFNNGYEAGMTTIDELIKKVREERGMKAPAPKAATTPTHSFGASLVNSVNR
ncbi:thiol:disulfide interchange protein DsbA/DsbL [Kingella kingae]|uniref:thiol:disulfide interchange protein DsbA/DsbL n=1 Tax=Kingella kingae TaxID=504 RepID=UPI00040C1803|nr:thiol:disulfide interchange protein DsbA/DsbL [Kingella kingae]MDK4525787.1 thiol:disulfide interchange protein DsbA/DsbL [Kingella kingae]MDK4532187.1 thiol:disulfide interchange protein DsbA/DsbL [Kingella kingae]MDK4534237.1 thiol:disulfide interchange protein DsbA/DsbL [Kingella kingae]MDK4535577.1 thiol:disulfide interchange protein DsbA/DsbL [Kingella kingae]MDK4537731.1 thiol:disulfide interchange protein DsbA/DsbL [Kingella kingae]